MYDQGYEDCYAGLDPVYPRDPKYMSGYIDAEMEIEGE